MLRTREAEDVVPALKRLQSALSPSFLPSPPLPVFQMLPQVVEAHGEAGCDLCPQSSGEIRGNK